MAFYETIIIETLKILNTQGIRSEMKYLNERQDYTTFNFKLRSNPF